MFADRLDVEYQRKNAAKIFGLNDWKTGGVISWDGKEKRDASFEGNYLEVILGCVELEMFIRIEMLREQGGTWGWRRET